MSLEDEVGLDAETRVVAGLMYSRRHARAAQRIDLGEVFPRTTSGNVEGHVAVLHEVSETGHVFVSLGRRMRFPTIKDRYSYREDRALPNPFLKPEQALNPETGYEGALLPAVQVRTSLFFSHIKDVIQTVDLADPATESSLAQLQNTGCARHMGGEVMLGFQVTSWLQGEGTYAYVHLENLSQPDLPFTHIPTHTLRVHLAAIPMESLELHGWITHASSRFTHIEGTTLTELDGYITVDAEAVCAIRHGIRFDVGIRNVLDVNYELVAGYPEPGRSAYVRMSYALQH